MASHGVRDAPDLGVAFELRVADAFRALGYRVTRHAVLSGSQFDLVARRDVAGLGTVAIVVDCKAYSRPVGVEAVRGFATMLRASRDDSKATAGVLVSQSGFTASAQLLVENLHDVKLLDWEDLEAQLPTRSAGVDIAHAYPGPVTLRLARLLRGSDAVPVVGTVALLMTAAVFLAARSPRSADSVVVGVTASTVVAVLFLIVARASRRADERAWRLREEIDVALGDQRRLLEDTASRMASFAMAPLSATSANGPRTLDTGEQQHRPDAIVRELHHSLGTPLAQIDAQALMLNSDADVDTRKRVEQIRDSVRLCWAFLDGYRASVSSYGPDRVSIPDAIASAVSVYSSAHGPPVTVNVEVESRIAGYTPGFVLAVLLPLLQNAVEASPSGRPISVTQANLPHATAITIQNECPEPPTASDLIYEEGFTTKPEHSGLGLAGARRLLEALPGAGIVHSVIDGTVAFTVTLPVRSEET